MEFMTYNVMRAIFLLVFVWAFWAIYQKQQGVEWVQKAAVTAIVIVGIRIACWFLRSPKVFISFGDLSNRVGYFMILLAQFNLTAVAFLERGINSFLKCIVGCIRAQWLRDIHKAEVTLVQSGFSKAKRHRFHGLVQFLQTQSHFSVKFWLRHCILALFWP
jgi:riboflavin transporter FmnP